MARLLVSVRSAEEAHEAVSGGADIIDVKEPSRGPLGSADPTVWQAVRAVVPANLPVSVALGELTDWVRFVDGPSSLPDVAWRGIAYAKLGMAGTGPDWLEQRSQVQTRLATHRRRWGPTAWVSVIYLDWPAARSPEPDRIVDTSLGDPDCVGILVDTWSKETRPVFEPDGPWRERAQRIRDSGRFLAWAGGLDLPAIERIAQSGLAPDVIAVRGAACRDGRRLGSVEASRVACLREAVARI